MAATDGVSLPKFEVYTDGAIGPINPGGTAAYGVYILKPDGSPHELWGIAGEGPRMTNNVAEYVAICKGLTELMEKFDYKNITVECFSDSQLVAYQMSGAWRIKSGLYFDEAIKAGKLAKAFPRITFNWIPREKNLYADELSQRALREAGIRPWFYTP